MERNLTKSFNPCFIGTYSFTKLGKLVKKLILDVLILVLLELILLQCKRKNKKLLIYYSFNPCFIGTYSFT